ncbi:MAG: 3-oxoacyl-[acyl-carrier-protein] reductase [Thermodesulfobacteriota bacterium]|nr:3-oxoacyl-[acyl-carrier-protein] reductase [Thermodesulfobacteriota bacterium]
MILKDKVAIVTGGGQGIGKEIVILFADNGAKVAVCDINMDLAKEIVKEIKATGVDSVAIKTDVADYKEAEEMVKKTVDYFGHVDILVNNAGITRDNLIVKMREDDWDFVLKTNLKGTFNTMRAVARNMIKQRYGKIINISSVVGEMGNASQANYSASKAGVIGLTKSIARELASRNINVNAVAPGFIDTAMTRAMSEKYREKLIEQIPMSRLGSPVDVANAVLFLASENASYITGNVIKVNGGLYM